MFYRHLQVWAAWFNPPCSNGIPTEPCYLFSVRILSDSVARTPYENSPYVAFTMCLFKGGRFNLRDLRSSLNLHKESRHADHLTCSENCNTFGRYRPSGTVCRFGVGFILLLVPAHARVCPSVQRG